jgi:hypothetical protein
VLRPSSPKEGFREPGAAPWDRPGLLFSAGQAAVGLGARLGRRRGF